jgi:gliding motility-associated-like protein
MKFSTIQSFLKSVLVLSVFTIASIQFLSAATYYVSKTGNDANNGLSAATAKLTITAAANIATSGSDIIMISTGYYAETVQVGYTMTFSVDSVQVDQLTMNKTGITLTIDGNSAPKTFNVKTQITLTDGLVKVGSNLLAFRALAGCTFSGGNKTSFIDGALHIGLTSGSTTLTFHIGAGSDYRPVGLSFSKGNGNLTYYVFQMFKGKATGNGSLPTGIRNYSAVSYFEGATVPANASNSSNFAVTLRYDSVSTDDGVYENSTLRIIGYTATATWKDHGGSGSVIRKGQITTSTASMSTLGTFALANTIVLTATERKTGLNILGSKDPFASYKLTGRCSKDTLKFTNLSKSASAILTNTWNFGEAGSAGNSVTTKNAVHKYANGGTYRVSLTVLNADGNLDSWVQMVTVFATPFVLKTVNNVCIGEQTVFTDFSTANGETISGWNWNLGDGPPATIKTSKIVNHTYTNPGGYKVILRVTTVNACVTLDTFDYVVHANPAPAFDPKDVCFGQSVVFDDQSTVTAPDLISTRKWDFGDGSPTSTSKTVTRKYNPPGLYYVKLISYSNYAGQKGACRDSIIKPVRTFALPLVDYTQSATCIDEETVFTDNTQIMNPDYAGTYFWTFGDGGNDTTLYGAKHTYLLPGIYKSRLTVTSNAGCISSDTLSIFVQPKPSAGYTVTEKCFGDSTAFLRKTQTVLSLEPLTTYSWKFDNTINFFTKNPKVLFATPGIHNVVMLAETNHGCRDSAVGIVMSHYIPNPTFSLDKAMLPNDSIQCFKYNNFKFNFNVDIDVNDTLLNTGWRWGDGNTESPATSNNHSYKDTGVYTVKLYGVSIHNCADSAVQQFVVKPSPKADFYKEGICVPDTILFKDTASKSARPLVKYSWDINGSVVIGKAPVKQYFSAAGPHAVSYIVEDDQGCIDTMTQSFTFTVKPAVSFSFIGSMPLCKGDSIDITASGGDTIRWIGAKDTNRTQKLYGKGWYKVTATSGICTAIDSVQVKAFPMANIIVYRDTTIYRGKKANLHAVGATNYWWTDSSTLNRGNGDSVIARPLTTRTYYVSGTDSNGCDDNDSVLVTVVDPPLVRIPNLITPNGDLQNDFWDLSELADLYLFDIRISDRQGKLVYYTGNYLNDWKAVDNSGTDLPPGIYFYYMKNRFNGEEFRGYIQVIR